MATNVWLSGAAAVAQVNTWTIAGTWLSTETITVAIGQKSTTITTGSTTIATIITTVVAALKALSTTAYPEYAEVTWGSTSTTITAAANTAGKPFTITISTNSALGTINGSASSTGTATTASAGPYDWSSALNWSTGLVPVGSCAAPVQSNPSATNGGSLTNGQTYFWVITATNPNGETTVSNEKSLAITAPNQTAALAWAQVTNATGYKIYRSTVSGSYGASSLVTTVTSGSTLTFNDTGAATTTGTPPGASTAVGDTVYLSLEAGKVLYGLDQHTITLTKLLVTAKSFTLGLPKTNTDATAYPEYRPDFLKIGATNAYVNTKSGRIKIDFGTVQTTYQQDASGTGLESNIPAVLLKGTHVSNEFDIFGGNAGIAFFPQDAATANMLRVGAGATVTVGFTTTLNTLQNEGGTANVYCAIVTLLKHPAATNGTTTISGTGAVNQITAEGGTVNYDTSGTLGAGGNTTVAGSATLTFDGDQRSKTVSGSIQLYGSGAFIDSYGVTSAVTIVNNHSPNVRLGLGTSWSLVRTPI